MMLMIGNISTGKQFINMADDELKKVIKPTDPGSMNKFEWKNPELQKWVEKATKLQDRHIADNNNTEFFQSSQSQFDAVQLRICIVLFGMKTQNINKTSGVPKGTPSSFLKAYSFRERRRAKDLQVKISKDSNPNEDIYVNHIYVSAAFPNEGTFVAAENPVFVFTKSRKYMDAGGRVYKDWDDYLRNNHLEQGVLIYPENGSYTPKDNKDEAKMKVTLIARETQSCKPSAVAKDYFDKAVLATGLILSGAAVVTAVPLAIFSATTTAAIATGSYYIGLATTTYSVVTNGYDKFQHDESVLTEMLLVGSTLFSSFAGRLNQSWSKDMAKFVEKTDVWDDVAKNLTRTQRYLFASVNIIKVAMSASSVLSALYHLCMKDNRTWLDYYQLCISMFFFANVVTKPYTLRQVFEVERTRFHENYNRSIKETRERVVREEAKEELEKAIEKAKTNEQKTYLIRNLQKIHDLDGHFYRVHTTKSVVEYTEKGLVINNQITVSPEAYNQMGKEYLQQRLDDIKNLPTQQERDDSIKELLADYESPDFKEFAESYVEGNMTPEQKEKFQTKIEEMGVKRKDQFFRDTAKFSGMGTDKAILETALTDLTGNTSLADLEQERKTLDDQKKNGLINDEDFNRRNDEITKKIEKAEREPHLRKFAEKFIRDQSINKDNIADEYVKQKAGGKTEKQWQESYDEMKKRHDQLPENDRKAANQKKMQEKMEHMTANKDLAAKARQDFNNDVNALTERNDVKNIIGAHQMRENFNSNERFTWHRTIETTKTSIQEIFGVTDYREATVGGKKIFKDLDNNSMDETSIIFDSSGKNTTEVVNAAKRLAEDPNCKMKVNNARDFNQLMNAVKQVGGDLNNIDHAATLTKINQMYDAASQALLNDNRMQFSSVSSAAVHAHKHKDEFGPTTTTEQYLTRERDALIHPENASVGVYTQDGKALCTNYGSQVNGRYHFGVVRTNFQTGQSHLVTMHVRSDAGVGSVGTNNTTTANNNGFNPPAASSSNATNPNASNVGPSETYSLSNFASNMSWFSCFY